MSPSLLTECRYEHSQFTFQLEAITLTPQSLFHVVNTADKMITSDDSR